MGAISNHRLGRKSFKFWIGALQLSKIFLTFHVLEPSGHTGRLKQKSDWQTPHLKKPSAVATLPNIKKSKDLISIVPQKHDQKLTKWLISPYRRTVITCGCVLLCRPDLGRQPMLYFLHVLDWIIYLPHAGYYSKVVAAGPVPASSELKVAEGSSVYTLCRHCRQSNLFIKWNLWVVCTCALFPPPPHQPVWNFVLPYQDGWI